MPSVSSLTTGKGVAGVEISWLRADGRILSRAETDGDSRANFAGSRRMERSWWRRR